MFIVKRRDFQTTPINSIETNKILKNDMFTRLKPLLIPL